MEVPSQSLTADLPRHEANVDRAGCTSKPPLRVVDTTPTASPSAVVAGKDTNIGAKRAREAREELGLDATASIPCILTTIEVTAGTPVVLCDLPETIAGCITPTPTGPIVWVNGAQFAPRQRFTLAHEFGHVRCGHDGRVAVDTFETLSGRTTDSREVQANAFAAEFLAPAAGVREAVTGEPTLETVVELAARFGLSTIAALYRLNTLGLTSRYRRLKAEIDAGDHEEVWARLDPPTPDDEIARQEERSLPRLSPALENSSLAAFLSGAASAADVARLIGVSPATFADRAGLLGV